MHEGTVEDRREKNEFENKERETKRLTGPMISGYLSLLQDFPFSNGMTSDRMAVP